MPLLVYKDFFWCWRTVECPYPLPPPRGEGEKVAALRAAAASGASPLKTPFRTKVIFGTDCGI